MSIRDHVGRVVFALALIGVSQAYGENVAPSVLEAEKLRIGAIAKAKPSAVSIFVPSGAGGGSGVVIDKEGYALTNFHVSSPAGAYMVCGMSDGNLYDAVIVGIDPVGDLAMIKLLGKHDFSYAEIGNSDRVRQGDWCMVIGNPFLLANDLQPTVTWGIVSGVHRYQYPSGTLLEYADCLQTDASINPGNSGGPLYDAQSRLIGIVGRASFEKRGRVNVGVGYAISINQATNFLGYLQSGRIVDHSTLGATVTTSDGKVVVSNILSSSDAYRRGLRYGAEILEVNGRTVDSANAVQNVLGTLPKGWRIPLTYRYEGETVETLVRLAGVHGHDELLEKMAASLPPPPPKPNQDGQPGPGNPHSQDQEIPEVVQKLYESKTGFANYHFNRVHQERLWSSLKDKAPVESGGWKLSGPTSDDGPAVKLVIDEKVSWGLDGNDAKSLTDETLYTAIDDGKLEGLAACIASWNRMLVKGPEQYGDVYYLGTMPLRGAEPLRDVLVATSGELESRFYFHPQTGLVESIECWADPLSDPAEIFISYDNDSKPTAIDLFYGLEKFTTLTVESWGGAE